MIRARAAREQKTALIQGKAAPAKAAPPKGQAKRAKPQAKPKAKRPKG